MTFEGTNLSFSKLEIPDQDSIIVGELANPGHWTVAAVRTGVAWPSKVHKISYCGADFWIIPATRDTQPAVAYVGLEDEGFAAQSQILRFLSALSWTQSSGIGVSGFSGGGRLRLPSGQKSFGQAVTADFLVRDLPEPNATGRLALALMREARSLQHAAYSFLTFYRVLEVAIPDGRNRGKWLETAINQIGSRFQQTIDGLRSRGVSDIGTHLQKTRRQAIAHASSLPVVDPDDFGLVSELLQETPIIEGLAELAIEDVLGIPTPSRIHREHLYELAGFRGIIQPDLIRQIIEGPLADISGEVDLPRINIRLRRSEPFPALTELLPASAAIARALLKLEYRSIDNLIQFTFGLHFGEERIVFDFQEGISARDDGTAQAARNIADVLRFKFDYIGNGELHIYSAETLDLLSRVDAFIPVNFFANQEWFQTEISKWLKVAAEREAKN